MTEVVVRHCRLRIVRTGGWSWGPDPDGLLAGALAALPEVVAERIETVAECDGLEGEIAEPLCVKVPVRLTAIRAGDRPALAAAVEVPLGAALARAVGRAPGVATTAGAGEAAIRERDGPPSAPDEALGHSARPVARSPLEQLAAWWRDGVLEELLRRWPDSVLRAWQLAVTADPPGEAPLRPAVVRGTLAATAEAAADTAAAAHPSSVQRLAAAPPAAAPVAGPTAGARLPAGPVRRRPAVVEARALPFLMLVPLARIGYLDALGPALGAARLAGREGAFASALARKALDPPEHGWRRGALDVATAAAMAGSATVDEEGIGALARAAGGFAPVLDSVLERAVLAGRDRAGRLVLHRSADLVLLDPDGAFPAAVGDEAAIATACGHDAIVRVTVSAAAPSVLAALDAAGVAFVTAAPPGRHEPWRRAGPGCWTNAEPGLARRCPDADESELDALLTALETRPGSRPGALERSLTLAAGVALGLIAWDLWRDHAATDATVALMRLGDLDARVRAEPGCVRVTIPLGRRHRELTDAGLLRPVAIPWLDSTLELSGG